MTDIYFNSLDSPSSDGSFLFEARSSSCPSEPFNREFTVEMWRGDRSTPLWSEQINGSIDWLFVDSQGYSALNYFDHDEARLEFRDSSGEVLCQVNVHHRQQRSIPNEFKLWYPHEGTWCSAGMSGWLDYAFPSFIHDRGKHYFTLLLPFGQELLVDLTEKHMIQQPRPHLLDVFDKARSAEMVARLKQALGRATGLEEESFDLIAHLTHLFEAGAPEVPRRVDHVNSAVWAAGLKADPEALEIVERLMEEDHPVFGPTTSGWAYFCKDYKACWSPVAMEAKLGLAVLGRWTDFQPYIIWVDHVRRLEVPFEKRCAILQELDSIGSGQEFFERVGPPDLVRTESDKLYCVYLLGVGKDLRAIALVGDERYYAPNARPLSFMKFGKERCFELLASDPDGQLVSIQDRCTD